MSGREERFATGLQNAEGIMRKAAVVVALSLSAGIAMAFAGARIGLAQEAKPGVVKPLADVKFDQDDDVKCLHGVLENGNPDVGPSTFLLKAAAGCVVKPHYHTAEEQLIVVKGDVSTGMHGMKDTVVGAGGFAMMPGKMTHWFTCTSESKDGCLMFVTFDQKYDIVWIKDENK
jgi:quercetin dioxygenase-like cupin family protein